MIYKTSITVEILSEEPIPDPVTLEKIAWEMTEGDWVGRLSGQKSKKLRGKAAAAAAFEFGSSPAFFGLNDDGRPIDQE